MYYTMTNAIYKEPLTSTSSSLEEPWYGFVETKVVYHIAPATYVLQLLLFAVLEVVSEFLLQLLLLFMVQ